MLIAQVVPATLHFTTASAPVATTRRLHAATASTPALYVEDGRGSSALVVDQITACDGQIFFLDKLLLPCVLDPTGQPVGNGGGLKVATSLGSVVVLAAVVAALLL